ncbi:hypothetical protein COO60DRAFT_713122 [Scenedesmus sp. NREL 46B-D3]|nr:hypothetical protein COO60DRAFT_713122 [Scenedesmus sp. NREL 46B-D3]
MQALTPLHRSSNTPEAITPPACLQQPNTHQRNATQDAHSTASARHRFTRLPRAAQRAAHTRACSAGWQKSIQFQYNFNTIRHSIIRAHPPPPVGRGALPMPQGMAYGIDHHQPHEAVISLNDQRPVCPCRRVAGAVPVVHGLQLRHHLGVNFVHGRVELLGVVPVHFGHANGPPADLEQRHLHAAQRTQHSRLAKIICRAKHGFERVETQCVWPFHTGDWMHVVPASAGGGCELVLERAESVNGTRQQQPV